MKAATIDAIGYITESLFQSTPPVKAATKYDSKAEALQNISIHAAREGGDELWAFTPDFIAISIHAAREGGDISSSV